MKTFIVSLAVLFHLAAFAAEPPPENSPSGKIQISKGNYITGGILASTVGLGIGHMVQNRWTDKGWIFTAGEVAGIALIAGAGCRSTDKNSTDRSERERSDCDNVGQALLGVGALIGFHAWEIVDIWKNASPSNSPAVALLPTPHGAALAFSFGF